MLSVVNDVLLATPFTVVVRVLPERATDCDVMIVPVPTDPQTVLVRVFPDDERVLVVRRVVIVASVRVPVWIFADWMLADWMLATLRVVVPVAVRSFVVILLDVSVSITADVALRRVTISSSNTPCTAVIRFVVILVMLAAMDERTEIEPV